MRTALAITHVAFEDLGTLEPILRELGIQISVREASIDGFSAMDPLGPDLVVVLGGPIGVYEQESYPFLAEELALLQRRLVADRPTLGICLGAQLMAAAVGAQVYPGKNGKEIGWKPVETALAANAAFPWLRPLFAEPAPVLHWHGDTFDLPSGAVHLARTAQYPHQAFALGRRALALQFHLEVTACRLERWYVGHACELAHAGISVTQLRKDGQRYAPGLERAAKQVWKTWLDAVL